MRFHPESYSDTLAVKWVMIGTCVFAQSTIFLLEFTTYAKEAKKIGAGNTFLSSYLYYNHLNAKHDDSS